MYKVWILAVGENSWCTNSVDHETIEEAQSAGDDLLSRWMGADKYAILPKDDQFTGFLSHDVIEANKVAS